MKLIHKKSNNTNTFYTAIVTTLPNGKKIFDFDPVKVRLALAISDFTDTLNSLREDGCLLPTYASLLTIDVEWEIEIYERMQNNGI